MFLDLKTSGYHFAYDLRKRFLNHSGPQLPTRRHTEKNGEVRDSLNAKVVLSSITLRELSFVCIIKLYLVWRCLGQYGLLNDNTGAKCSQISNVENVLDSYSKYQMSYTVERFSEYLMTELGIAPEQYITIALRNREKRFEVTPVGVRNFLSAFDQMTDYVPVDVFYCLLFLKARYFQGKTRLFKILTTELLLIT